MPYVSAHLDGAASELVVHADHSAQDTPDTIGEIRRILMVHLAQVDRGRAYPIDPMFRLLREPTLARPTSRAACRTCSRVSIDSGHAWLRKIDPWDAVRP